VSLVVLEEVVVILGHPSPVHWEILVAVAFVEVRCQCWMPCSRPLLNLLARHQVETALWARAEDEFD